MTVSEWSKESTKARYRVALRPEGWVVEYNHLWRNWRPLFQTLGEASTLFKTEDEAVTALKEYLARKKPTDPARVSAVFNMYGEQI